MVLIKYMIRWREIHNDQGYMIVNSKAIKYMTTESS